MKELLKTMMILSLFLTVTGCSSDSLSGKSFGVSNLIINPLDGSEVSTDFMTTFKFNRGTVTQTNDSEITGSYTLDEDRLKITFTNDHEELTMVFSPLSDTDIRDNTYQTELIHTDYDYDNGAVRHFERLTTLSNGTPVYFVESDL